MSKSKLLRGISREGLKLCYTLNAMDFVSKVQFLRKRVVTRRSFQISAFILILALFAAIFFLARAYLNLKSFLVYGYSGVFLINLICCATILFPIPGEAVNIAAGATLNPLLVGMVATVGATIGELTSYLVGYLGRKIVPSGYLEKYEKAEYWMKKYGSFAIFLFALLPILIFDLIGIVAGSARFPLWKFILACFVGRLLRCLTEAYLGYGAFGFLPQLW
ncbi:MAG: VTT domain-containing protein [Dehalococcoidia bacterium]|nr:VTT domain-containing protein [Dehalococcoidia bacterium]